jgi:co-chaperonin GroES (HSP10)
MSTVKGKLIPLGDKVLASDMNFGEQRTLGGIVILGDDGRDHGVHPRWCRVFAKGPDNKEEYQVGDWLLVEHGRWTRGIKYQPEGADEPIILRMIDVNGIIMWDDTAPEGAMLTHLDTSLPTPVEEYRI